MTIKIIVSDTVGIKVKGTINDAAGVPQPFDFGLTCIRLDAEQIAQRLKSNSDESVTDFLADVVEGWSGVRADNGDNVPYSAETLRQLCKIPGLANLAFATYLAESGAKAKN